MDMNIQADQRRGFIKIVIIVAIILVLAIGSLLRLNNLDNIDINLRTSDERIYTYQATKIAELGREGVKLLVREDNVNKGNWLYPLPTRIGYTGLLAAIMKMTNMLNNIKIGAYISCFFSIIGLLILIALGLRFFNPYITLFGLLFLSVSPMDLAIARRTWQDAMLGALSLSLVYMACEITRFGRKMIWYVLFIFVGSYCILIKESGLVVYLLCLLWILSALFFKKKLYSDGAILIIAGILGAVISVSILAYAVGGFPVILEVLKHHLGSIQNNEYALINQTGPWYNLLLGLWILDPMNLILCFIGIVTTFVSGAFIEIAFFMITFFIIAVLTPHCQNLRYLSVLYALFYLMAGTGLWHMLSFCKSRINKSYFFGITTIVFVIIVIAAIWNYQVFINFFIKMDTFDLSIKFLKESYIISKL